MSRSAQTWGRYGQYWKARLRLLLIGAAMENVVFRREIGMDPFGRLKASSPLYRVHGLMAATLLMAGVVFLIGGWESMIGASILVMGLLVVGTQPIAASRAFGSLARDRAQGSLEEYFLSSLGPEEVFEGKFFGLLAPLVEMRRYVAVLGGVVCLGFWRLDAGPWALLVLALWLTGINQIGHSLYCGTLAGLKWGLLGEARAGQIVRDWRLNPWPYPIWLHVKAGLMLGLPLVFLFWLGARNPWTLYSAFGLLLVVPFYVGIQLHERQEMEFNRLRSSVRLLANLENPV